MQELLLYHKSVLDTTLRQERIQILVTNQQKEMRRVKTFLGISNFVLLTMHPFDRIVCFFRSSMPTKTYCTHYTRETTIQAKKKKKKKKTF